MSQPSAMEIAFYALVLILPVSALVARRLPAGSLVKMALAWVAIFALLFALVLAYEHWFGGNAKNQRGGSATAPNVATLPLHGDFT